MRHFTTPSATAARISVASSPLFILLLKLRAPADAAFSKLEVYSPLIGKATEDRAASQWDALQRLSARFLDTLNGLATLRLFGRADAQVARVREVTDRYRQATLGTLRVAFLSALVLELLSTLSVALVAVSLGIRLTEGHLDLQTALVVLLFTSIAIEWVGTERCIQPSISAYYFTPVK